ncbi:Antigenic thaumatin-like protein [Ceratocystis fimbriata CBS 114723]|uniref:Antigenic thaumatin-like protein n=1 Tax=Ceratocystis fimbriata CBS 114723 TaxID=1035309 RepID=A0A2C5XGB3_9PEZI|nr:Antigenic thaumatin-like protein [Ceratocystis fimbriata CBS 114723]
MADLLRLTLSKFGWLQSMKFLASLLLTVSCLSRARGGLTLTSKTTVVNKCTYPLYLWSVSSTLSPRYRIAPHHGSYCEFIHTDQLSLKTGIALKITPNHSTIFDESSQMIFGYTLDTEMDPTVLYYGLSNVFGTPFEGMKITLESDDPECSRMEWPDGVNPGHGNYMRACSPDYSVVMVICADGNTASCGGEASGEATETAL